MATQDLDTLKINYLTQEQYNAAKASGQINANELYLTPNTTGELIVSSEDASNPAAYPQNSVWLKYGDMAGGQADWVIETGTSGIWEYRKWNSGISECWGSEGNSSVAVTAWSGTSLYTASFASINWPTGLFITAPRIMEFAEVTSGNGWLSRNTGANSTGTGVRYVITPKNTALSQVNIHTYAIGRWKA